MARERAGTLRAAWRAGTSLAVLALAAGFGAMLAPEAGMAEGWLAEARARAQAAEYAFSPAEDGGYSAPNRAHGLRAHVGPVGLTLRPRLPSSRWELRLGVTALGRGAALDPVPPGAASAEGTRAVVRRATLGLAEWYVNTAEGVEQGFTLQRRPAQDSAGPLVLALAVGGSAAVGGEEEGGSIRLVDDHGATLLRYGGLSAVDARGRALPVSLSGRDRALRLQIDDAGAAYPITVDPLLTSPSWSLSSPSTGFGASIQAAGDVNGDGYGDVLVAAPDQERGHTDEGLVFLYLGSAGGLDTDPAWFAESDLEGARLGEGPLGVAGPGDVNGDGYDDVLIGCYRCPNGTATEAGLAMLFFGGPSSPSNPSGLGGVFDFGRPANADWIVRGSGGDRLGAGVARAGDVNGDGHVDIAIGLPGAGAYTCGTSTCQGQVRVYHGGPGGISPTAAWSVSSRSSDSFMFGSSLSSAGDVDADGFDDLLVGHREAKTVYLFRGSAAGLTPAGLSGDWDPDAAGVLHVSGSSQDEHFGASVAGLGDVNADGYADFAVGSPLTTITHASEGRIYVQLGGSPPSMERGWRSSGTAVSALLGESVAAAGDVNRDGYADVLASARGASSGAKFSLWYGGPPSYGNSSGLGSATPDWTFSSGRAGETTAVAGAGDVNGDGLGDVLVSSAAGLGTGPRAGAVQLFLGSVDARGRGASLDSTPGGVPSIGDVNGDGFADLLLGFPDDDTAGTDAGKAMLYLGSGSGASTTATWTAYGAQPGARFGASVAIAGDVDGNNYADAVVGSPGYDTLPIGAFRPDVGRVDVFPGDAAGLSAVATSIFGVQAGEQLGARVASAGDVNGDGMTDVLIGAPEYDVPDVGSAVGRVFVHLGKRYAGLRTVPARTLFGYRAGSRLGAAMAAVGDVDGDGYGDFAIGDPSFPGATPGATGWVEVRYGSSDFEAIPWRSQGNEAWGPLVSWGAALSSAGDVNGDGFGDFLVGAPLSSPFGLVTLHLGSAAGFSTGFLFGPDLTGIPFGGILGPALFGATVAAAGDVDGDGFEDVLIGAPGFTTCASPGPSCSPIPGAGLAEIFRGSALGLSTKATSAWTGPGGASRTGEYLAAGDFTGDGLSDWVVGSSRIAAIAFLSGEGPGRPQTPRQARTNSPVPVTSFGPPIARFGLSPLESVLLQLRPWLPLGRTRLRVEADIARVGPRVAGWPTVLGPPTDTGSPRNPFTQRVPSLMVENLTRGEAYRWRIRLRSPVPVFGRSPWVTLGARGASETSFRVSTLVPIIATDVDRDGLPNVEDNCPQISNPLQEDMDLDRVGDVCDNCRERENENQRDTNGDGYGNVCDADLDGDGIVNFVDLAQMKRVFFGTDEHADLNGDGVVNFVDLALMKQSFFKAPGPPAGKP